MFDADRAEQRIHDVGTPQYEAMRARDHQRRERVIELLATVDVESAEDLYYAAWILNHGDQEQEDGMQGEDAARAHELARRSAELGFRPALWLAAAALDRSLMYSGRPQKYGTDSVPDGKRFRVWDVDPTTTDEERAEWDVPPLAELERRAAEFSQSVPQPQLDWNDAPKWLTDAIARWRREEETQGS
jgi:hypothetical protein